MSLKKVIEKKRSEECNTENACEGYNTIRVLYEQTVMGGAVLTGIEPSGRESRENKGQTDVKHKIFEKTEENVCKHLHLGGRKSEGLRRD